MIVFSSLQIRRGIRVLLDNATATVNPVRRSARWVKRLRQIHAAVAAEGRIAADGGSFTFPGNWALARVNQRHRRWTCRQSSMLSTATASFANSKPNCRRPTIATTATPSPPCTASWTPSTPDHPLPRRQPAARARLLQRTAAKPGARLLRRLAHAPQLAQALVCRSDLLLLDEPTNHRISMR